MLKMERRFFLILVLYIAGGSHGQEQPNVFDLPRVQSEQTAARLKFLNLLAAGELDAAELAMRSAIARVPHDFTAHYNLARSLARQERIPEALASLKRAVQLGLRKPDQIRDDNELTSLRGDPGFQAILDAAGEPMKGPAPGWKYPREPAKARDRKALITAKNVAWIPRLGMFQASVEFPESLRKRPIASGPGRVASLLRKWFEEGTAAGNHQDLYDNHDNDHSNMNYGALPQLTRIEYSEAAKQRQLHNGLQRFFLFNAVTIGNSSTAITGGEFWRCQGRFALTQAGGGSRLYLYYRNNHLYFYPEHRDHDPGNNGSGNGDGDLFPANTPYLIISQGSSGSDRPFMNAVAQTLAAFSPGVKEKLKKTGLLMPTVQMIFRLSNKSVKTPSDYLSGTAHPTVFDAEQLDVEKMVTTAHRMKPESLPPLVQLKVVEELQSRAGKDYFDAKGERLFDTPCAIARIVKSTDYFKRLVVSAAASRDVHGKPLTFDWVVLRGDASRIRLKRRNQSGSEVEVVVPYHLRMPIEPGSKMESSRVDIGAFVHNGSYYSAPGFISLCYLANERRVYDERQRIQVMDYADPVTAKNYADPLLQVRKDWRDEYQYDDQGKLQGWRRIRAGKVEEFTADGRLVVSKDGQGRPEKTSAVRYVAKKVGKSTLLVQELVESH